MPDCNIAEMVQMAYAKLAANEWFQGRICPDTVGTRIASHGLVADDLIHVVSRSKQRDEVERANVAAFVVEAHNGWPAVYAELQSLRERLTAAETERDQFAERVVNLHGRGVGQLTHVLGEAEAILKRAGNCRD